MLLGVLVDLFIIVTMKIKIYISIIYSLPILIYHFVIFNEYREIKTLLLDSSYIFKRFLLEGYIISSSLHIFFYLVNSKRNFVAFLGLVSVILHYITGTKNYYNILHRYLSLLMERLERRSNMKNGNGKEINKKLHK